MANTGRPKKSQLKLSPEEEEFLTSEDATDLWAHVYSHTRFHRRLATVTEQKNFDYNRRLLYLLAVAVFRRVEQLVNHRDFGNMLRLTESYAEGEATDDEFYEAYEKADAISTDRAPAAKAAAVYSIHLLPDDYKVLEGVYNFTDAAGYLATVAAGELSKRATYSEAAVVRESPAFLAGKAQEERAVCALIRDIMSNPFRPSPILAPAWLAWQDGTVSRMARSIYEDEAFDRLPILGDALEDAGCTDASVLGHLRGAGPHVRGCWAVDLILGKA
jgi:hypothetical protein